ncbi:MAG: hypothetical protein PHN69_03360 [Candidatus Pacebacteria bacterium]|nr:hypothetical protein [Candidatus Paceibacterota bacterium]
MKIKNIFENNIFSNSHISKNSIKPCREWIVLIVLLFVMIISSIIFDIITYQKIIRGEMYVSVGKDELIFVKLEKDKLKDITDRFEEKKEYVSKAKIENIVDPSM